MPRYGPKTYRNLEEFDREELRPGRKLGWSLDDLYHDAAYQPGEDNSLEEGTKELDFDF